MYLLDANIYINFYDRYYKREYFPSFWEKLPEILNTYVIIPSIVVSETYHDSSFKEWLEENYTTDLLQHEEYVDNWASIIEHVSSYGYYKKEALNSERGWAQYRIADPWIIAIAKEGNHTIVTEELRNPNLNSNTPSRNAKIPDVCDQLGIRCIDMNSFFREINLRV